MQPISKNLTVLDHELHFLQWGQPTKQAVIMLHGFSRNSHDFDVCARKLATDYYVICPDLIGRGLSQWSLFPADEYSFNFYHKLLIAFLELLNIKSVYWVGSSLGGIVGTMLANNKDTNLITKLVLNDIGPIVPDPAIIDTLQKAANPPIFNTIKDCQLYLQKRYKDFGIVGDQQWYDFTMSSLRRKDNGQWTLNYDPKIVTATYQQKDQMDGWALFEGIDCPLMVIRGELSNMLTMELWQQMQQRKPQAIYQQFPDVGHTPFLNNDYQINALKYFLDNKI